jgi:hypothetical protein
MLGKSDIPFQDSILHAYFLVYGRDVYLRGRLAVTRVRLDLSWRRVLELAVDSWEATLGHGAR